MKKILFLVLIATVLFTSCESGAGLHVGQEYLFSYDFDTADPFRPKDIDRVKILDKKDGYIKWINKEYYKYIGTDQEDVFSSHGDLFFKARYFRDIPVEETTIVSEEVIVEEVNDSKVIVEEVSDDDYYDNLVD